MWPGADMRAKYQLAARSAGVLPAASASVPAAAAVLADAQQHSEAAVQGPVSEPAASGSHSASLQGRAPAAAPMQLDTAGRTGSYAEGEAAAGILAASAPPAPGSEAGEELASSTDRACLGDPAAAPAANGSAGSAAVQAASGGARSAGEAGHAEGWRTSAAASPPPAGAQVPPNAWHAPQASAQEGAWVGAPATGSVRIEVVQGGAEGAAGKELLKRRSLGGIPQAGGAAVAEAGGEAVGAAADAHEGAGTAAGSSGPPAPGHEGSGLAWETSGPEAPAGRAGPAEGLGGGPGAMESPEAAHGLQPVLFEDARASEERGTGAAVGASLLPAPHWRRLDDLLRESGFAGLASAPQAWPLTSALGNLPHPHVLPSACLSGIVVSADVPETLRACMTGCDALLCVN